MQRGRVGCPQDTPDPQEFPWSSAMLFRGASGRGPSRSAGDTVQQSSVARPFLRVTRLMSLTLRPGRRIDQRPIKAFDPNKTTPALDVITHQGQGLTKEARDFQTRTLMRDARTLSQRHPRVKSFFWILGAPRRGKGEIVVKGNAANRLLWKNVVWDDESPRRGAY